jgi:fatty-acyl-CoA synthase
MAAVVGAPDDDFGEAAHAYVVTAPGAEVTAGELADLVRAELADWWVPAAFHFVDSLPLTPTGKINTAALSGSNRRRP